MHHHALTLSFIISKSSFLVKKLIDIITRWSDSLNNLRRWKPDISMIWDRGRWDRLWKINKVTMMLVTSWCWRRFVDVGDIVWLLVLDAYVDIIWWSKLLKLSPTSYKTLIVNRTFCSQHPSPTSMQLIENLRTKGNLVLNKNFR